MFFKGGRDALGFTSAIRCSPDSTLVAVGARHAFPYQRPDRSRRCGLGGPLAGRANGPVARVGDTASPEWQSCVEISPPRRRVFARGPVRLSTDQARHPRFASRTDFAGQSGGFVWEGGSRVGVVALPQGAGVCAWACGLALLASPDSAVAAARFAVEAGGPASNLRPRGIR